MAQVEVTINGRGYTVACEAGQEGHLAKLAATLDTHVTELAGAVGQLGDARLLVMAGLLLADELEEARGSHVTAPAGDEDRHAEAIESLAGRLEAIADKLSGA